MDFFFYQDIVRGQNSFFVKFHVYFPLLKILVTLDPSSSFTLFWDIEPKNRDLVCEIRFLNRNYGPARISGSKLYSSLGRSIQ